MNHLGFRLDRARGSAVEAQQILCLMRVARCCSGCMLCGLREASLATEGELHHGLMGVICMRDSLEERTFVSRVRPVQMVLNERQLHVKLP